MSDNLAKARAAVAPLITHDTGDRPRWRVIHTDSESPTGVALTCTGDRSNALHMIDDYPGGPIRDEEGVYDCCPWPQFETCSPVLAAYLVALLNADAEEKATAPAATATPQSGDPLTIRWDREVWHAESDTDDTIVCCLTDDGQPVALFLDDELREALGLLLVDPTGESESTPDFFQPGHTYAHGAYRFRCEHLTTHPTSGHTSAWGWFGKQDAGWRHSSFSQRQYEARAWTDVTEAGDRS